VVAGGVKRTFKYRFVPTDVQAVQLKRTFGCVRKVYNLALAARTEPWAVRRERIGFRETSAMLTGWKKTDDLAFLAEVSSVPLQQALRHLQTAFTNFFAKRAGYPRFKAKHKSRASAAYTRSAFTLRDGQLTLAKMDQPLDIAWSRPLPDGCVPSTVTVSQDAAGRWFVSLLCDDPTIQPLPAVEATVGIDLGLQHLVVLSTGEKIANPRHERKDRGRLVRAQRALARKAARSANRDKARLRVGKVHARIADRRRDHLHQLSTRLVRENQTLVIEDLTVRNMVKNHRLARAISDAAWAQFRSLLEYKARWYGRQVVVVDRFFPSSKLCSDCGILCQRMPLNVRTWTCDCGATHDRDVNAAKNLLTAGLAVSVCGADVRPQRKPPEGQSAMKQKALRREL